MRVDRDDSSCAATARTDITCCQAGNEVLSRISAIPSWAGDPSWATTTNQSSNIIDWAREHARTTRAHLANHTCDVMTHEKCVEILGRRAAACNGLPQHNRDGLSTRCGYSELTGTTDLNARSLANITLDAFEVATITLNLTGIANNLTYGEHYRLSVYVNCKPCPPRYICNQALDPPDCDVYPSMEVQQEQYDLCLQVHTRSLPLPLPLPLFSSH